MRYLMHSVGVSAAGRGPASRRYAARLGKDVFGGERLNLASLVCGNAAFDFRCPSRFNFGNGICSVIFG